MDKDSYTYYINDFLPVFARKYQGWAVNNGRLLIIRCNDMVKILVSKYEDKSIKKNFKNKYITVLVSSNVNKPYEAKKILNDSLKQFKISKTNDYSYKIDDETLLSIVSQSGIKFGKPFYGTFQILVR